MVEKVKANKRWAKHQFLDGTVFMDEDASLNGDLQSHEIHGCTCPVCQGQAEHRVSSWGYEDIECVQGCGLVWLRGEPTDPNHFIDKRPDKSKKPCDRCNGLTIH